MSEGQPGTIVTESERPREGFDNPARGDVSWVTLFSGDRTPTESMSAGIAHFEPNGVGLAPHRHTQAEIYYIVSGSGVLTIEGVSTPVAAGTAVFIPGDAEHAIRPLGNEPLRVFYVFPTDRFSDVVYRFPPY